MLISRNIPLSLRVRHIAPVLFALAVLLLVALSLWWFLFIQRSIGEQYDAQRELLRLEAVLIIQTRINQSPTFSHGPLPEDPRFEIVHIEDWHRGLKRRLDSGGDVWMPAIINSTHVLVPTETVLNELEASFDRRKKMIIGEGGLLASLLLVVLGMLSALVRSERRFNGQMEAFLGLMTHELKTPLAGIKAVLQTIELGRIPPDRLGELTGLALQEVRREEHLIQNLLLTQRMRQPGCHLVRERMDLAEMLRVFVGERARLSTYDDVNWDLQVEAELEILGDPGSVRVIVENLSDNAVKYGAGLVTLSLSRRDDRAVLRIKDNGMGFPSDQAERLFEAFARGSSGEAAGREGTGLGLHISRTLARRMGGELRAQSSGRGQGASFELTLPLAESGEAG